MLVARRLLGVDGCDLDLGVDRGLLDRLTGRDDAGEGLEPAADLADREVADDEADLRVRRVDVPGAGGPAVDVCCADAHVFS